MHFRRRVEGYVLEVIRKPRSPKLFLECYCMARKSQSGVSLTLRFQPRFRPFVLVLAHTCIRQNTVSFEVYINMLLYMY